MPHRNAMPKRNKHKERSKDVNELARALVDESTAAGDRELPTKAQVSALMAQLGRKGGKIGGKRRLETMSKEERTQVARRAARMRWNKGRE